MISFEQSKWEGLDGLGEELLKTLRPKVTKLVKQALVYAESELKITLTGRRHGRTYRVNKGGRKKQHIASAPGEPPAVLWGNLRMSVGHTKPEWDGDQAYGGEWGIGLGQKPKTGEDPKSYAVRLEYGGVDKRGVKLEARPYMAPTEERIRPVIEKAFREGI